MNHQVDTRMLYGDNMQTLLPLNIVDVSTVRQVPDNQEVFTHPSSDQSLIFEILEYIDEGDEDALKTHFQALAVGNDANSPECCQIIATEVLDMHNLSIPGCRCAYLLFGKQMVAKYNEPAKNAINVYMALYRLPERGTDILLSMNDPQSISPQSSSHRGQQQNAAVNAADIWTTEHFRAAAMNLTLLKPELLG